MAQIIQFFVQFLEGHVAGVARDADVDGVDPVAEACAQIDQCVTRRRRRMRCRGPCLIAFFLAPPLKVRLRGGAGRAAQCASRRTRTRRAMGLVSQARAAAPAELRAAVCSALAEQACDRRPCGVAPAQSTRQACDRVRRGLRGVGRRPGPSLVARRPHSHSAGAAYKTPCEHAVYARVDQ